MSKFIHLFFFFGSLIVWNTGVLSAQENINIRSTSTPNNLNPSIAIASNDLDLINLMYNRLQNYDPITLKLNPELAESAPKVETFEKGKYAGGMALTFKIREGAKWDNGQQISANDVLFTLKTIKNPKTNAGVRRPYYDFVNDLVISKYNPREFTVYTKTRYFAAEDAISDLIILPEYKYDPNQLMRKVPMKDLCDAKRMKKLDKNPAVQEFADLFNNPKLGNDPESLIAGSGPYKLKEWIPSEKFVLELKKNWWGNKSSMPDYLKAYPKTITYKIVETEEEAIELARKGELDIITEIKPSNFVELSEDKELQNSFNFSTPEQFAYYYIGLNTKKGKLEDRDTRRALAHLIDRKELIKTLLYRMGKTVDGPIPSSKNYYNSEISPIQFSVEKAQALLQKAGWKDTDEDGILDKKINGERTNFTLKYKFNKHNPIHQYIGELFKVDAKKAGIQIELVPLDWSVLLQDVQNRDFELIMMGWGQSPSLEDMKQIWHSDSDTKTGSNFVGFGNSESDQLIDDIRTTVNPNKMNKLYQRLQEIIYKEQPYIFLFRPFKQIMISKKFKDNETFSLPPNYNIRQFKTN